MCISSIRRALSVLVLSSLQCYELTANTQVEIGVLEDSLPPEVAIAFLNQAAVRARRVANIPILSNCQFTSDGMVADMDGVTSAKYSKLKVQKGATTADHLKHGRASHFIRIEKRGFFGFPKCLLYLTTEEEANEIETAILSLGASPW